MQTKLEQLMAESEPVQEAIGKSTEGVLESLKRVADEIKKSFDRSRKSL